MMKLGRSADNDHVEGPGAVDAFDPVQLDVAGGGRAADPGERPGGVEDVEGVGYVGDDLVGLDDADVQVRDEGERPPTLTRAVVEDDRAGLGDPDAGSGDDAVEGVEVGGREAVVADGARDRQVEPLRYDDAC